MKSLDRFQYPGKLLEGGDVVPNNPRYTKGHLAFYEPCDVIVVVERRKRSKSRQQLGYLFGVIYPEIANHTGHSVEELDAIFKEMFLKKKVMWRGADRFITVSKADLTTNEMAEFITNVITEAGELGIEVPEADPAYQFHGTA